GAPSSPSGEARGAAPAPGGDGSAPPARAPEGGAAAPEAEAPRRPWWEKTLIGLGAAVAVLVVLLGVALFVLLGTEWGRQRIQGLVVVEIQNLLAEGATVEVDRLEGNFLTGARLTGLVIRQDGELTATIDTVLVEYNLITLLDRRFSADELYVGGPTVYARQRADSTWNLAGLLRPTEPDAAGRPFVVHVDSFGVARGRFEARFLSPRGDSVLAVRDLRLAGSSFHSGPDSLTARLDTVRFAAVAPGDAARLAVAGAGLYDGSTLALNALTVTSPAGTDVRGRAEVTFAGGI